MANSTHKTARLECPQCDFGPFTRNYYYTGKLLVERDFWDEQCFHREKLRHHHQRLHGWGVACGLKVKQHENPECRNRFVCIEPGTAIDCCGHEILVREEECIDINQFEAIKTLREQDDQGPHTLQICIRYLECPTEEMPVLYDECGCDDARCAPNRILESYEFDVVVDPETTQDVSYHPRLEREATVDLISASMAAVHGDSRSLYVTTTGEASNTLHRVRMDDHTVADRRELDGRVIALAVSNNGKRVYVVLAKNESNCQLLVLDTTQTEGLVDANAVLHEISIKNSQKCEVYLAVAPESDNRLFALVAAPGKVLVWGTDINEPNVDPERAATIEIDSGRNWKSIVIDSIGRFAYVSDPVNNSICVINISREDVTDIDELSGLDNAEPSALAIISTTESDLLAVADRANNRMHLIDPSASKLLGSVELDFQPVALAASPGSHWVYVLEQGGDNSKFYVQPVDVYRLKLGKSVEPGEPIGVDDISRDIVLTESGDRLYVVGDGGVSIFNVIEPCSEFLYRHLEGCPECDVPNCVVLATIERYYLDYRMEDQIDPPVGPEVDEKERIARTNNRLGRRLLPSTQTLKELIECLSERGYGGRGLRVTPVEPGASGEPGEPGPGLEENLTRINALSWIHNGTVSKLVPITRDGNSNQANRGIVIGFTNQIQFIDGSSPIQNDYHIFQVLVDRVLENGLRCQYAMKGEVIPVAFETQDIAKHLISSATEIIDEKTAPGLAFIPDSEVLGRLIENSNNNLDIWVRLRGDFVLDDGGRAIDAEFVRAKLATGDRSAGSTVGVQGGLFESWFTLTRGNLINVNEADRYELIDAWGIGPSTADKILEERELKPFSDLEDVRIRARINKYNWSVVRNHITIVPEEK